MDTIAKHSFFCPPPTVAECRIDPNLPFDPNIPGSNTVCTCTAPPAPQRLCTASVSYPQGSPGLAQLVPMEAHCDATGAALALYMVLGYLLGAP